MLAKKICAIIMALAMVITFVPVFGHNAYAETSYSGQLGDNVFYTVENGVVTITGTGGMYSYNPTASGIDYDSPFYDRSDISEVIIGEGVTDIGNSLFLESSIKSVSLPTTLKGIGTGAFYMTKLESIDLSNTQVERIGMLAFYRCRDLAGALVLPNTLTYLGSSAFMECSHSKYNSYTQKTTYYGIESVTIPGSLENIPSEAFCRCENLQELTIGEGVKTIGDTAFADCRNLTSLYMPDSLTTLGNRTFGGAYALTSVRISPNLETLPGFTFANSSITSLEIPEGVKSIGQDAVMGCRRLTEITIPDSVESIGRSAFSSCESLTSISLPADCSLAEANGLFQSCFALTSVTLPDNMTEINDYMFCFCKSLQSFEIPETVTRIGHSAFADCYALESVTIPDSVTTIDGQAFEGCTSLESVTIPASVTEIGNMAFVGCNNLTDITVLASDCTIGEGSIPEGVTIHCYDGSTAQEYAEAHGIPVVSEGTDPKAIDISTAQVTGLKDKTYSGSQLTQSPVVELNGAALTEETNYKLSYENNTAVGLATMTVTGIHGYTGTVTATFKVLPKKTSLAKVTPKKKSLVVK